MPTNRLMTSRPHVDRNRRSIQSVYQRLVVKMSSPLVVDEFVDRNYRYKSVATHLCLYLPKGLFPVGLPVKIMVN